MLKEQRQAPAVAVQADCPHLGRSLQAGSLQGRQAPLGAAALALNALQELDVDDNELRSLDGLQGCPLLVHLSAAHNRIAAFPTTLDCVLLQHLNLSCNRCAWKACQGLMSAAIQHMLLLPQCWVPCRCCNQTKLTCTEYSCCIHFFVSKTLWLRTATFELLPSLNCLLCSCCLSFRVHSAGSVFESAHVFDRAQRWVCR